MLIRHHFSTYKTTISYGQINVAPLHLFSISLQTLAIYLFVYLFIYLNFPIAFLPSASVFILVLSPPGRTVSGSCSLPWPHLALVRHLPGVAAAMMGVAPTGVSRAQTPRAHQGLVQPGTPASPTPGCPTSPLSGSQQTSLPSQTLEYESHRIIILTPLS